MLLGSFDFTHMLRSFHTQTKIILYSTLCTLCTKYAFTIGRFIEDCIIFELWQTGNDFVSMVADTDLSVDFLYVCIAYEGRENKRAG